MKKCNDKLQPIFNPDFHKKNQRGPSSFNMHDSSLVFNEMNIKPCDVFVDLGCGIGEYSLYASRLVGESGRVFAVDVSSEMLALLRQDALSLNISNITTIQSDICHEICMLDNCADHCLLATVMHAQKVTDKCIHPTNPIFRY